MALEPKLTYREPLKDEYPELARFSGEIVRCIKCGLCRAACPTLIETLSESEGARGRVSLVEAVLDGRLALSDVLSERIASCINCKACIEACKTYDRGILQLSDGKPSVAHLSPEEVKRRGTECLACEYACRQRGKNVIHIDVPIKGLDDYLKGKPLSSLLNDQL